MTTTHARRTVMRGVFFQLAICAAMAGSAYAQRPNIPTAVERTDRKVPHETIMRALGQPTAAPQTAPKATTARKWCRVFISRENGNRTLVVDDTGKYLDRVREIKVAITVGRYVPMAQLRSWDGVFKPSADKIETAEWNVREIKIVDDAEFEAVLNGSAPAPPATTTPAAAGSIEDLFEE